MAIDVNDLPPTYRAQAMRKLMEQERRKQCPPPLSAAEGAPVCGRKYHNRPTERVTAAGNVLRFDSQKEARRYDELSALEQAGEIRNLRLQVDFTLQEAYTDSTGKRVRAIRYKADFTYEQRRKTGLCAVPRIEGGSEWISCLEWRMTVEDVKSRATRTKEYILKRKLMKERFNIDIQEV